jgi:endonuclease/exonuclease/phosphatase (EEP) superfamily protein YafD
LRHKREWSRLNTCFKWVLNWWLVVAGGIASLATLIGFAGSFWWFFELFSHFRLQYLVALTIISMLLLLSRRFRLASVLGLFAILNLAVIIPYYARTRNRANTTTPALRAVSINVNTANKRFDLVRQYVLENSPDFLLLVEVDDAWLKGVADIERLYPYRISQPQNDNFGIALYSKYPCKTCKLLDLGGTGIPSVVGEFEPGSGNLTIVGTHPLPPKGSEYASLRNRQLNAIAEYVAELSGQKMLLGDLNATPWSPQFRQLLRQASLSDSANGFGLQLTWPSFSYLQRVPIDHCLVSSKIEIVNRSVGPDVGSDHFPILIDFKIAR